MSVLSAAVAFILANKVAILVACALGVKFFQAVVALLLLKWPQSPFLLDAEAFLAALIVHLPTAATRERFRRRPLPPTKPGGLPDLSERSDTPTASTSTPALKLLVFALAIGAAAGLVVAGRAQAQVLSVGASLPMLEFQPNQVHPVAFAPGLGVEASLGFLQRAFFGEQWDLLDVTAQLFGSAPGALQVALGVGTFNDIIFLGAAVPLFSAAGGGAFQGSLSVYPILGGSIPFELGPYSPPEGTESGALGLRRGATVYLPL